MGVPVSEAAAGRAPARTRVQVARGVAEPLADQPIAIPRYRYHVRESQLAPLPYVGYAMLRGDAADRVRGRSVDPADIGNQLGAFLRATERRRAVASAANVPRSISGESASSSGANSTNRPLALPAPLARACATLLDRTPPLDEGPPQFQHGDLGAEHILVDRQRGRITAIIDWGDAGWGNSVADLVGLWAWGGDRAVHAALPPWGRSLSDDDWVRLRMWGAAYAIGSAYYGYKDRRDPLRATALGWLERMQRAGQLADPGTPDA